MEVATATRKSIAERFITTLKELDRGDLAVLRRNAGMSMSESRGALGLFYSLLPANLGPSEEIYFLVATLFPWNQREGGEGDFGRSMAIVRSRGASESLDRRMTILLDADFDWVDHTRFRPGELGFRLRQSVKLMASKEVAVDWQTLLRHLLQWSNPEKWVQKEWARSYFGVSLDPNEEVNLNVD